MCLSECKIIDILDYISQGSTKEEKQVEQYLVVYLSPIYTFWGRFFAVWATREAGLTPVYLSQGIVSGDCGSCLRKFEIRNADLHEEKIMVSMKPTSHSHLLPTGRNILFSLKIYWGIIDK